MTTATKETSAARTLKRFIYPTRESGQDGIQEFHTFSEALQEPMPYEGCGVMENGKFREFTPEEEKRLGIVSLLDDPVAEQRFWDKAKADSGQEKVLYGKDEKYPLRERIFTDESEAEKFAASLREAHLPFIYFQ